MKKLILFLTLMTIVVAGQAQTPSLSFTMSTDTIIMGDVLTLSNTSTGFDTITKFHWSFGDICYWDTSMVGAATSYSCNDSTIGIIYAMNHIYDESGDFTITLTAIDSLGNSYSFTKTLHVTEPSPMMPGTNCEMVCNGDFESYVNCFYNATALWYVIAFTKPVQCWSNVQCISMPGAVITTPDYYLYNSCVNASGVLVTNTLVPNNGQGCQPDQSTGNAYVGIFTSELPSYPHLREYVTSPLIHTMVAGQQYLVSYWVSLSEASTFATYAPSAYFSVGVPTIAITGAFIPAPSTNLVTVASFVTDKIGWTHISQIYTAVGGEANITLGNFKDDGVGTPTTSVTYITCSTSEVTGGSAYYYIDNVSVTPVNPLNITVSPSQVCLHPTQTVALNSGTTSSSVNWSSSPTSSFTCTPCATTIATPSAAGTTTYTASLYYSPWCTFTQSGDVNVIGITVHAFVSVPSICHGSTVNLWGTASGGSAPYTYSWDNGSATIPGSSIMQTPSATTTYTLTVTDANGCTGTSTVTVTVYPLPTVTVNSPAICNGATATLTAGGATTYTWSAGATSTGVNTATVSPTSTTTYTVTGTDVHGCTNTASSTVTVNPIPVVTVTSPNICIGATATITASGATTYIWSAGATSTGVNTATASPATTTSYTVTGTITATGCTNTAVSTVTVNPVPTVNPILNQLVCDGAPTIAVTISGTTGATFNWTNSDPSIGLAASGTGNIPAFIAVNPTTIPIIATITVTPVLGGCSGTATTFTYTVTNCCFAPAEPDLGGMSASDLLPLTSFSIANPGFSTGSGPISITGKTFNISGFTTFDVNVNLVIRNCEIILGPSAKIDLNGHTLTIRDSYIHGCGSWDGIYANDGLGETLIIDNTLIEDAKNALNLKKGVPFFVTNCVFNKNVIGIQISGYNGPFAQKVENSVFTCQNLPLTGSTAGPAWTTSLLVDFFNTGFGYSYPFATLTGGGRSQKGIEISNATNVTAPFYFGNGTYHTGGNIFNNMNYGIMSLGSDITVYNSTFTNITDLTGSFGSSFTGFSTVNAAAIYASGMSTGGATYPRGLIVNGVTAPPYGTCYFNSCDIGVYAYKCNNDISNNYFDNIKEYGVLTDVRRSLKNIITLNNMTQVGAGILCFDNQLSTSYIDNNVIDVMSPSGSTGIINDFGIGIVDVIPGLEATSISGNIIQGDPEIGIITDGAKKVQAILNEVDFSASPAVLPIVGALVFLSDDANFDNNTMQSPVITADGDGYGFFIVDNPKTILHYNHTYNMGTGVFMADGIGTCNNSTLYCNGIHDAAYGFNFGGATIGDQVQTAIIAAGDDQNNQYSGITVADLTGVVLPNTLPYTKWYNTTAPTTWLFSGLSFPSYSILNCVGLPPAMPVFNPGIRELEMGKIVRGENTYDTLSAEYLLRDTIYAFGELRTYDTLMHLGTDDSIYQAFYDYVEQTNVGAFQKVNHYIVDSMLTDTTAAIITNNNIRPRTTKEENLQMVNSIYLRQITYEEDTLNAEHSRYKYDSTEYAELNYIAHLSSRAGGEAVAMARKMLFIFIFDDEINATRKPLTKPLEKINKEDNFVLYPNPNDGKMILQYSIKDGERGEISINDVTGKLVNKVNFYSSGSNMDIDESKLEAGIYFYEIRVNNIKRKQDKLVIIK